MWTMIRVLRSVPYFNKRIVQGKTTGQSLVEFALVSLILFFVVFGIMEMARLMFIFSQVSSAAQEGTRYGSRYPRQITGVSGGGGYPAYSYAADPCNIISQARARIVLIAPTDVSVEVGYDNGAGTAVNPFASGSSTMTFEPGQNRVVVTTTYTFRPVVGLFDPFMPNGLPLRMVSARTIQSDQPEPSDISNQCDYSPASSGSPTNTVGPGAPTNTPVPAATATPFPTPTSAPSPTPTPCLLRPNVSITRAKQQSGNQASNRQLVIVAHVTDQQGNPLNSGVTVTYSVGSSGTRSLVSVGSGDWQTSPCPTGSEASLYVGLSVTVSAVSSTCGSGSATTSVADDGNNGITCP
jgi:Flp pilus assembly protein TadG